MKRVGLVRFVFAMTLLAAAPLGAVEFGVSLSGGVGFWNGEWNKSVQTFSEDFSQSVTPSLCPVGSLFLDATFRQKGPLLLSVALGAGFWGGRVISSGGTAPDRVSSVAGIGLDLVPTVGLRFPAGKAEFGADLRVGLGLLVSPLWTIDAWPTVTGSAAYQPQLVDLGYFYAGSSLVYGFPLGDYALNVFISGDVGIASFDASSGTKDPIMLMRAGIGARLSYDSSRKKRAYR
ncbi:MAG: hypothetical protein WCT14_21265 [Treponemataceae bacterium]